MPVKRMRLSRKKRYIPKKKYTSFSRKRAITRYRQQPSFNHGWPTTMRFVHKYHVVHVTSGGATQNRVYRCNSVYDPDFTGPGTTALNFSQMSALYDHWTVIGSKITVKSIPTSTVAEDPYRVTLWTSDTGVISVAGDSIPMQPYAKSRICSGLNPTTSVLTSNWSLKRNLKGSVSNSLFRSTGSTNPTEQQYFVVSVYALDGGLSSVAVNHDVSIEYIVLWTERKQISV